MSGSVEEHHAELDDIAALSAHALAGRIRAKSIDPTTATEAALHRINLLDDRLKAMITVDTDGALKRAEQIKALLERHEGVGPLAGVPVVIKDVIETAGIRTTYGSSVTAEHVPTQNALLVDRIERAGGIIVGKANTSEHASHSTTTNLIVGTTVNPWNESKASGGSSGGSAVAVATGMAALAIGTDHGGSVRIPSAFNGIVGLRPTPGRVPVHPNPWEFDGLDVPGPMGRTVEDVALLFDVLRAGREHSPVLAPLHDQAPGRAAVEPHDLRVAWSPDLAGQILVDDDVRGALEALRDRALGSGANWVPAAPDMSGLDSAILPLRAYRGLVVHAHRREDMASIDNASLRGLLESAPSLTAVEVATAERVRSDTYRRNRAFFGQYDVLVTATTQVTSYPATAPHPATVGGELVTNPLNWGLSTYLISLMGWPAVTLPCGMSADGVPIGVQIVGQSGTEDTVLRFAEYLQDQLGCTSSGLVGRSGPTGSTSFGGNNQESQ